MTKAHKGWHSRGYLPHLDAPNVIQAVTFRLADALPRHVVQSWHDAALEQGEILTRVADFLDAGHGSCILGEPFAARSVEEGLFRFDGERYKLIAWVVMPTHVHVVVETLESWALGSVVGSWKGASARRINLHFGCEGRLWQPGYFDRYIRNEDHLHRTILYIDENPVKAGLVEDPSEWPYSSASRPGREKNDAG